MSIIHQTIQLLLAPPGGLVYHLLILFSLEAILGMALGAWQRRRAGGPEEVPSIFVAAAAGMLLARVVLVAAALAGVSETLSTTVVIPPLERALDTAVTLLLVWALMPWGRHQGLSWFVPGFGLVGTAMAFALFLPSWQTDLAANPNLVYSVSWQQAVWSVAQLTLLGLGSLGLLWRRGREWGLLLAVFMLLAAGHILQLLTFDDSAHIAGWVRLSQLMAFPLLAVALYRRVIGHLSLRAHELEEVSQDSLSQIAGLIYLIESSQRTVASLDMAEVSARAVREVVRILKADLCGLVFPVDVAQGKASLAAAYSAHNQGAANVLKFSLAKHPALEHAIKRKKQVTIDATTDNNQLKELYILMGSMETGPLLIQPLMYNSTAVGALLLGNHHSQQWFTASQKRLCQALSRQVAIAIENARHYQAITAEVEALQAQLQREQEGHQRVQAQLETQLKKSQEDAAHFARQLDEATTYVKRKQQNVESLAAQLQTAEEERSRFETQVSQAQEEINSLQQRLKEQIAQTEGTRAALDIQLVQANDQISQMKLRLQQYRDRTSLADAVLDAFSVGLLVTDENGRVKRANATAEQLLAKPLEQMLGHLLGEICVAASWKEECDRFLRQADASTVASDTFFTADCEKGSLTVRLRTLRDEDDQFAAVMALLDFPMVSQEARQARDEFLGALAQELRTPMTSITGYTDLLLGESVGIISEMQRKFLQRIKANIERMAAMLNDLIGVTAIDSGQLHLEPEPIEVGNAIQEALLSARAQLEEKDLSLHLNLASDVGTIEVDPHAFHQIMSNLINNACKASPVGGEIGIQASYETEGQNSDRKRLVLSVTDSGGGIIPEDQPRVFDRFYRAEQALIAGLGETGVGLSIVKALIEAHNGEIWVESEMERGTTFAFALPTAPVQ